LFYTCDRGEPQGYSAAIPFLVSLPGRANAPFVTAAESEAIGYGGVSAVARVTGVSRRAITEGMKELNQQKMARRSRSPQSRIRRKGAGRKRTGRKRTVEKDLTLLEDLDRLVDPVTRRDPESPLRWTCKSVRRLLEELQHEGHAVSYQAVAELSMHWTIACRPIRRRWRGASTRIAMSSLNTSTVRSSVI